MKQEYYRLKFKEESLIGKIKALIISAIQENGGRISFRKKDDNDEEDDYPITTALYGRKGICSIPITDVYLDNGRLIHADGMDDGTGCLHRIQDRAGAVF